MAIPRIFKLPRHRQFEYQPVFYNPEREEREARNKEIKMELGSDENEDSKFKAGRYRINVFNDKELISSSEFVLK